MPQVKCQHKQVTEQQSHGNIYHAARKASEARHFCVSIQHGSESACLKLMGKERREAEVSFFSGRAMVWDLLTSVETLALQRAKPSI
jgi:hypothetical protein